MLECWIVRMRLCRDSREPKWHTWSTADVEKATGRASNWIIVVMLPFEHRNRLFLRDLSVCLLGDSGGVANSLDFRMPQNAFFLRTRDLLISPKTTQRHFLFTLHPLSKVIFATATVLAFVLLRNSNFNFHCYTQREATPTQKSAPKCAATSRGFLHDDDRLQSAFTQAKQLHWIAQ